jgi:Zn-finger nucleic acid-binding protein
MAERNGIEIDYCPQCRGVWLDRGELDKIIDRAAPQATPQSAAPAAPAPQYAPPPPQSPPAGYYYKKKKRDGFLGELFDFD